ncbi:MAG TPA: HPr family phosphocarrier protein [Rhodopirellula sp.]|nr:HPr family phosphocarrier protein [Rhodopirellula sp.]
MNKNSPTRTVTVRNPEGLHARPADLLVRMASNYQSNILIGRDGELVDCKSILSLLTLGAAQGTVLTVSAEGSDAEEALNAIEDLFEAGFDDKNEAPGTESALDS